MCLKGWLLKKQLVPTAHVWQCCGGFGRFSNSLPGPPQGNLRGYVREALGAITRSWVACPWELCDLFSMLRGLAADRFPGRKELQYSVISVFLFLRFFAAAILSPKLFELCSHPIVSSADFLPRRSSRHAAPA